MPKKQPKLPFLTPTVPKKLYDDKGITKFYNKLDVFQSEYYTNIQEYSVTTVDAKSGSGKTTIAVAASLQMLNDNKVSKVYYVRFPSSRMNRMGFLPGNETEKSSALMFPFFDACVELGIQLETIDVLIDEGIIFLTTDITMRGRNLKDCCVILDETQNGTLEDIQLITTRVHDNSKLIMIGHSEQCDLAKPKEYCGLNAFQLYNLHFSQKDFAVNCDLPRNYRGEISRWADEIQCTLTDLIENKVQL